MSKSVIFKPARAPANAEEWVQGTRPIEKEAPPAPASPPPEAFSAPMSRLTIDIPQELHRHVKSECSLRGTKMADVIRKLLEREFPRRT